MRAQTLKALAAKYVWWKSADGPNFQPSESLKALTYFDDGDLATFAARRPQTLLDAVNAVRDLPHVALSSKRLGCARGP